MKKNTWFILPLILLTACGQENLMLDDYRDYDMKVGTKHYESEYMNYSMSIPEGWVQVAPRPGAMWERFADSIFQDTQTPDPGLFFLNVTKIKEEAPTLQSAFDAMMNRFKSREPSSTHIVESGSTDFLQYESYFFHHKTEPPVEAGNEGFAFVAQAPEDSTYYVINFSVSQHDEAKLEDNLGMVLTCIRSFKLE